MGKTRDDPAKEYRKAAEGPDEECGKTTKRSGQAAHEVIMRKIVIILCTLDVILMALSVVLYLDEDRTAPVIYMEDVEMEYREGMTDEEMLSGVTATDETNGDVTGSLVVEKVSEIGDGTVIVTFGARDRSNNVVKASRVIIAR